MSVEIKELRCGNYITYNGGTWEINAVDSAANEVDLYNYNHVDGVSIEEIDPIPLTEDILLKCGFELNGDYFRKDDFNYFKNDGTIFIKYQNDFYPLQNSFWYLHELQNLIFFITGKELITDKLNF